MGNMIGFVYHKVPVTAVQYCHTTVTRKQSQTICEWWALATAPIKARKRLFLFLNNLHYYWLKYSFASHSIHLPLHQHIHLQGLHLL